MLFVDFDELDDNISLSDGPGEGITRLAKSASEVVAASVGVLELLEPPFAIGDKRAARLVEIDPELCEACGEAVFGDFPCNLLRREGDSIRCCGMIALALLTARKVISRPSFLPLRFLRACCDRFSSGRLTPTGDSTPDDV